MSTDSASNVFWAQNTEYLGKLPKTLTGSLNKAAFFVKENMQKRPITIKVRLAESELDHLNTLVAMAKLSRESYVRMLISGVIPRAVPSKELLETIRLLRNIANNINQIAKQANTNGSIEVEMYKSNYIQLQKQIDEIMWMIREPTKMEEIWQLQKSGP